MARWSWSGPGECASVSQPKRILRCLRRIDRTRIDAETIPPAQHHLSRRCASPLGHVTDPTHMNLDAAGRARLRVPGGKLRRAPHDVFRHDVELLWIADDDVAARGSAADVQPEIVRRGDLEG